MDEQIDAPESMKMPVLTLSINGEACRYAGGPMLSDLLAQRNVPAERVAVLVNEGVVPRAKREGYRLCEGDQIEILTLAAGG